MSSASGLSALNNGMQSSHPLRLSKPTWAKIRHLRYCTASLFHTRIRFILCLLDQWQTRRIAHFDSYLDIARESAQQRFVKPGSSGPFVVAGLTSALDWRMHSSMQ